MNRNTEIWIKEEKRYDHVIYFVSILYSLDIINGAGNGKR